jgi:hypothetical protein
MKAIVCDRYEPPAEVLRLTDIDAPVVARDEVLVRGHAVSVNPADWHRVRGQPYIARLSYGLPRPRSRVPGAISPERSWRWSRTLRRSTVATRCSAAWALVGGHDPRVVRPPVAGG